MSWQIVHIVSQIPLSRARPRADESHQAASRPEETSGPDGPSGAMMFVEAMQQGELVRDADQGAGVQAGGSEGSGAAAASDAGHEDHERLVQALLDAFDAIDESGDGQLSRAEVVKAVRRDGELADLLGLPSHVRQEDGSRDEVERLFQAMDTDGNKLIDKDEFVTFFAQYRRGHVLRSRSYAKLFNKKRGEAAMAYTGSTATMHRARPEGARGMRPIDGASAGRSALDSGIVSPRRRVGSIGSIAETDESEGPIGGTPRRGEAALLCAAGTRACDDRGFDSALCTDSSWGDVDSRWMPFVAVACLLRISVVLMTYVVDDQYVS